MPILCLKKGAKKDRGDKNADYTITQNAQRCQANFKKNFGAVKKQPHLVNARQRLYDLFAELDCRERPIFTTKSGGAQATTHLSSPEHPSESFCLPLHFQCRGAPAGFEAVQKKSEGFLSFYPRSEGSELCPACK